MASDSLSPAVADQLLRSPRSVTFVSSYLKTVFLHDWWLIKVDANSNGRQLGVGGYAARKGQAIRTFHSAAIVKRYDAITLETADGIKVTVTGFINRSRTLESGYTFEVCNHFLCGFPSYWEKYTGVRSPEESYSASVPCGVSWNNLPATQVRDILMSSREDCGNFALAETMLNDILHEYGAIACCNPETESQKRAETATDVNSYKRVTRSQTVRTDKEELSDVPSNVNDAAAVNIMGVPMFSSYVENKGVKEHEMSDGVNGSSRRAAMLRKCVMPARRSSRLRKQ